MAQDYTRQSTFADGDTITAALFNDEYNQLVNAFAYSNTSAASTGHRHDGSSGQGGNIPQIGDLDFNNKIVVDDTNNRWGFFVEVSSAAVEQIRIQDGAIVPVTTNDIDLGTASLKFKDIYIDGTVTFGSLSDGTITITGFVDEDTMVSNSATLVPTQQSVKAYVDSQVTAQDLDFQGDTGGALSIDLDSESLTIAGGTGIDTVGATNTLTVSIDSTVTTLTGTQTLTNKTLTSPVISTISNTGTITLPTSTDTLVGRATTDTLTNKTLTSPVLNTGVTGTAILDDDTFATASATTLATSESIKAYVDAQVDTADTLAELTDTNITTPSDGALLFYDTTTSKWIDNVVSGDITIADTGVASISAGAIVNADINASAAISVSKTALTAGTGLTLSTNTLSVNAAQTQITSVGALNAGSITSGFGAIDNGSSAITTTGTVTFGNLADGTITITGFVDEDNMVSNSATLIPTQQSVKAYVDSQSSSGTVTSVAMSVPTGLTVSGSPITSSGTLAVSYTTGYAIPTTAKQTQWDTAYGWGDHSTAGYLTDIVSDTTPQLGGDLDTNGNNINFADNVKANFGASSDLQIYHNGSHSFIEDKGTGNLYIDGAASIYIRGDTGNTTSAVFNDGGSAALYHNGSKKIETTTTGITVTGEIVTTGGNSTNWNTAYGWGDHSTAGYLTGITGQSIENLSDVTTMTPTNGQVLTWDNTNSYWYAADAAGGSSYAIDETGRIETGNYIQFTNSGGSDRMFFKINDGVTTNTWGGFGSVGGYQFDLSTVNKKIIIEDGANGVRLIGYHKETGGNEGLEIHGIGASATKSTVSIITNSNTGIRVTNGGVYLPSIPSTDPSSTGAIWNDNGVVVMSGSTAPSSGLSTTSSSPTATTVTTLENLNSSVSLNTKGDGNGFFVGPNNTENTGFATSYSIFGLPAVSTPYHGGISHYGTARTMVSGRNAIGLAISGASAGLNSATAAFVVHNTSSTPVFKVEYGTGTTTTNNLIVDGSIEEQQYSLTGTDINPANGTIQYKTLAANTTFTESLTDGEYVILMIDDGTGFTITWPTMTWVGGSAPTLETTGFNVINVWQVNGTVYGAFVGAA